MIKCRFYDEEKRIDKVWYDSSNVVYSECDDVKDDFKILRVVFKNGTMYEYRGIDVNDYVMFVHGGLDGSNGKALNKFIKKDGVEYVKLGMTDLSTLKEEMEEIIKNKKNDKKEEGKEAETKE